MRKLCVLLVLAAITPGALAAASGSVLLGPGYGYFAWSPSPRGAMVSGGELMPPIYGIALECFRRPAAEALVHSIENLPANALGSLPLWGLPFLEMWSRSACRVPAGDNDDALFRRGGKNNAGD